jgi:aryl-alcohol dehydrogenase-like predicted oxidoreductase
VTVPIPVRPNGQLPLVTARGDGRTGAMDKRRIGSLDVSIVGLGTNNFGMGMHEDEVPPVVNAALDAGINFFDTSDSYGDSEQRLGTALGRHRDEVVIATKFGSPVGQDGTGGARPAYVREAVERSLRQLGTDRIDLYQLHRPDPNTPIADTLGVLDELVHQGKVREIGCSNFSAELLREANDGVPAEAARFASVQNQYNLLNRGDEGEVIPECQRLGLAYLPFFPLASGMLTGKYTKGEAPASGTRMQRWGTRASGLLSDQNFAVVDALSAWTASHDHNLLQLAFAWLIEKPVIPSVIAGATKADQVRANAAAAGWLLSAEEVAEVDALAPMVT